MHRSLNNVVSDQPRRAARRGRRAFTLLDILIALVVVTVLVSLMLPAIGAVQETARKVRCGSNLRQLGVGVQLYANGDRDRVPARAAISNASIRGTHFSPLDEAVRLRYAEDSNLAPGAWTGLGLLFGQRIIETPAVAYCPSHPGAFTLDAYAEDWGTGDGELAGNFYLRDESVPRRLSDAPARTALAIDGFSEANVFNHEDGANVLRADISVSWKVDTAGDLATSLFSSLMTFAAHGVDPSNGGGDHETSQSEDPWRQLDLFGRAKSR
ncbi:MAG: hypothetical protein AAGK04_02830 [Planctomycetota bacterium]